MAKKVKTKKYKMCEWCGGKHYNFRPCKYKKHKPSLKEKLVRQRYPELFED